MHFLYLFSCVNNLLEDGLHRPKHRIIEILIYSYTCSLHGIFITLN